MIEQSIHRATMGLGLIAVASSAFALTAGLGENVNLIHVSIASAAVLATLGLLAIVAGARKLPLLGFVAGVGFLGCALLQLVQLAQPVNLLGGDGSTMALFGGLGIGLVSAWIVGRTSSKISKGTA